MRRSYCWARMSGTLGLSERRGGASWPLRLLNMGSVDRGGAAGPRLPAMVRSSSPLPWMVWWWYSWILSDNTAGRHGGQSKVTDFTAAPV